MAASAEELAYETALTSLNRQEAQVVQLRARTGTLLAAASVVASFFGAAGLDRSDTEGPWAIFAIVAFAGSFGCCLYLLAPKEGLSFYLQAQVLYDRIKDQPIDTGHLQLATWLEAIRDRNQAVIDRLNKFFVAACVALACEVAFWLSALGGTI